MCVCVWQGGVFFLTARLACCKTLFLSFFFLLAAPITLTVRMKRNKEEREIYDREGGGGKEKREAGRGGGGRKRGREEGRGSVLSLSQGNCRTERGDLEVKWPGQ